MGKRPLRAESRPSHFQYSSLQTVCHSPLTGGSAALHVLLESCLYVTAVSTDLFSLSFQTCTYFSNVLHDVLLLFLPAALVQHG